jgi:hypothetical protein
MTKDQPFGLKLSEDAARDAAPHSKLLRQGSFCRQATLRELVLIQEIEHIIPNPDVICLRPCPIHVAAHDNSPLAVTSRLR